MNTTLSSRPPVSKNESKRLAELHSYDILGHSNEAGLDAICRIVASIFHTPIALVSLSDTNRQVFKGRFGFDADELARDLAPCAYAILGDAPLVIEDASQDPRFAKNPLVMGPPNMRFYVGMPLVSPKGFALGTLCAIDSQRHHPSAEKLENLADLARTVMEIFELRRALVNARNFAMTDGLTGLANRAGLMVELERVISRSRREASPFALLYVDVDDFKCVNDTRGHAVGDAVLELVGQTLQRSIRREDVAGRMGGDEYAVVIPDTDGEEASTLARRILDQLSNTMRENDYPVGFSIGLACFPSAPAGVAEALEIADRLMYRAKNTGKNRIVSRVPSIRDSVQGA